MTPEEAQEKYDNEWPALNAAKEAAVLKGDHKEAKRCRQQLSRLSLKYAVRHVKKIDTVLPNNEKDCSSAFARIEQLETELEQYKSLLQYMKRLKNKNSKLNKRAADPITEHSVTHGVNKESILTSVEALLNERDELRDRVKKLEASNNMFVCAFDEQMVTTFLGVFKPGDDPVAALHELMCWSQELGEFFAKHRIKELEAKLEIYESIISGNTALMEIMEHRIKQLEADYV